MNDWSFVSKIRNHHIINTIFVIITVAAIVSIYYSFRYCLANSKVYLMYWFWPFFYFELRSKLLGILLLIPGLYAGFTLGWTRSILVWSCSLLLILPYIAFYSFEMSTLIVSLVIFLLPLIMVASVGLELKQRRREKETLREREVERKKYMTQIFKSQESERKRIAQELHDGLIQEVLVLASRIRRLKQERSSNKVSEIHEDLEWVESTCIDITDELRRICQDLRPSILDNLGLMPALRWYIDFLFQGSNIDIKYSITGKDFNLPQDLNAPLFRLVQEALNNVKHHSEATELRVFISSYDSQLEIVIADNGKGFRLPKNISELANSYKSGIIGMYERAQMIGAKLNLSSIIGKGTTVTIEIALQELTPSTKTATP